ncbi:MAG: hypothetical protein RL033_3751 [Pseudomonadota bacterium]|jgi:hypothetical protein
MSNTKNDASNETELTPEELDGTHGGLSIIFPKDPRIALPPGFPHVRWPLADLPRLHLLPIPRPPVPDPGPWAFIIK